MRRRGGFGRAGLVAAVAGLLLAAAPANADVSSVRSMPVSAVAFVLDPSDDIWVARNGAIDHYSSTGAAETGFTTSANFASPNDIDYSGGRIYALSIDSPSSVSRLYTWNPNGSGEVATSADLSSYLNLARGLDVSGSIAYVGTGETNHLARFTVSPVLGGSLLIAGAGVVSGTDGTFDVCTPVPKNPCNTSAYAGTEIRHINFPRDVAIDESGDIYVADGGTSASVPARIHVLNSDPAPVGTIGTFGSGAGQLNNVQGVALDDAEENLFVADAGNNRVMQFEVDGTFVQGFGYGVDTGASALETCTAASTCQAGIGGNGPGQLSFPYKLDFDSAGDLYVSNIGGGARIEVLSLDGVGPGEKSVRLTADPTRVKKGDPTKLTAKLSPCPETVDEPVVFERKADGTWKQVGDEQTANGKCKASHTLTIRRRSKFRVRSEATASFPEAISSTRVVRLK